MESYSEYPFYATSYSITIQLWNIYNFYIVSTNFSPKKKIQNNIDINFRIDRYTLHDEIFSISAWNLDTLSLAWSIKQEVYTENK